MSHTHSHSHTTSPTKHNSHSVLANKPYFMVERDKKKHLSVGTGLNNATSSTSSVLRKHFGKAVARIEARIERDRTKPVQQCEHLEKFKRKNGISAYKKLYTTFVSPSTKRSKAMKAKLAKCRICRSQIGQLICLHCVHFACSKGGHMRNHYLLKGHTLALNLSNGSVYCFKCCDIFYDRNLEEIAEQVKSKKNWVLKMPVVASHPNAPTNEQKYIRVFSRAVSTIKNSTLGLRGLINLGHTCFMSCIMQSLIHTPMLRDYFTAIKIVCNEMHDPKSSKPCLVSLISDLYQEFYDGGNTPVSLHGLMFKVWGTATHLAGYEQQDAHEFFIAMLDALHSHFHKPGPTGVCPCVIDLIFLGRLQSAVACMACGHRSITFDPFWDTSLDLTNEETELAPAALKLEDCLDRYTSLEHLGSSEMIWCAKCKGNQVSTKQLKFQTLPIVLCLHLKRFEHKSNCKKIDARVDFPEHLYMNRYMSGFSAKKEPATRYQQDKRDDFKYSLYAVVNHEGTLDGGHYYAFIRHNKNWYKCDDHFVTRASQQDVLSSPGYLLFYHKEVIYYDETTKRPKKPTSAPTTTSPRKMRS